MRVTIVAPHLKLAGGTRIFLTYAHRLALRGHRVTVVVRSSQALRRLAGNLLRRRPTWLGSFRPRILRVPTLEARHVPPADAVVATSYQTMEHVHGYPPSLGRQLYLIQHDERLYHGQAEDVGRTYRYPSRKLVVARWLQQMLEREYGQPSELLINPIDTTLFRPVPSSRPADTVRVLLLDHTYEWKGTAEGAVAVAELKRRYPTLRLITFGVRRQQPTVASDEHHFDPPQADLPRLYSSCDIFLCPSWDEGFGLPSAEAMACGCAVVTYDNGGSREFAFHERTALVAPRRDRAALAAQLERLVVDAELRRRLAEAGRRFVTEQLPSWDAQVERLELLLATP